MPHSADQEDADLSEDDVRAGVTGHNVRYVLAAGLTGIITAFAALAIYFGFDAINERMSAALARNPSDVIRGIAPYAAVIAVGALVAGLLLGLWNLIAGRSEDASELGMRLRVVLQFATICVIMSFLYIAT